MSRFFFLLLFLIKHFQMLTLEKRNYRGERQKETSILDTIKSTINDAQRGWNLSKREFQNTKYWIFHQYLVKNLSQDNFKFHGHVSVPQNFDQQNLFYPVVWSEPESRSILMSQLVQISCQTKHEMSLFYQMFFGMWS